MLKKDLLIFRVCVICLAESHPLIRENKTITKVSFGEDKWNRLDNKFSGKSKRVRIFKYTIIYVIKIF